MLARDLRTPQEQTRYRFALAFSVIAWIALVVSLVGALYGLLIAALVGAAHALFLAAVAGNGVRIGPNQLPELWARVCAASEKLGLPKPPETYVIQSHGVVNAFATRLLGRRFVILHSDLVEACENATPSLGNPDAGPTELDFVIAHEIAHVACGHLSWVLMPARAMPWLGPAYSRACEYTADACGHALVGNLETSSRALSLLAGGPLIARRMDLDEFTRQRLDDGGFWRAVWELNATHPYLPKRVAALRDRERPGSQPVPGRNPFAYVLAPFFSLAQGGSGAAAAVMIIAILAAIAIPAFQNYMTRARVKSELSRQTAQLEEVLDRAKDRAAAPPTEQHRMTGDVFAWHLPLPATSWHALTIQQARAQNPVADGMASRMDKDAHVVVIAEPNPAGMTLDQFAEAVVANTKSRAEKFQVVDRRPFQPVRGKGMFLQARATLSGIELEFLWGLVLADERVFQVMTFAPGKYFASVEPELRRMIESFEPEADDE